MRYHTPKAQEARRMASEGVPLARISRVLDKPISWVRSVLTESGFLFRRAELERRKQLFWFNAGHVSPEYPRSELVARSASLFGVCDATIRVWLAEFEAELKKRLGEKK